MEKHDVGSHEEFPFNVLSNFAPNEFEIDGVKCSSMEGFLQSLKFKNLNEQEEVCKLYGVKAKYKGKVVKWWKTQTLWWKGKEIDRHSERYQQLIDRAYDALASQNQKFRRALIATGDCILTHNVGKHDPRKTILTVDEFVSRLYKLRKEIKKENGKVY